MAKIQGKHVSELLHDIAANGNNVYAQSKAIDDLFEYQNSFLPTQSIKIEFNKTTVALLSDDISSLDEIIPY